MQFNAVGAMKHIKYLEEEKQRLLERERNNSTIDIVDEKEVQVEPYEFAETRKAIGEIDTEIANIKHALNVFNTTQQIEGGITIDKALVKLAQLNRELHVVQGLKMRPKESYEQGYRNSFLRKVNYSLDEVNNYYKSLIKEIHTLQMAIDEANMTNKFEV